MTITFISSRFPGFASDQTLFNVSVIVVVIALALIVLFFIRN